MEFLDMHGVARGEGDGAVGGVEVDGGVEVLEGGGEGDLFGLESALGC